MTARAAAGDGFTETWTTYATVWASVEPYTAGQAERVIAATQQTPITHLAELDYTSALRASHRLLVGGTLVASDTDTRKLYVRGLQDVEERHVTYLLACEERAA